MTPLQHQLFDFLVKFNQFCKENNIQYCLFWGTLLGCIREKGFIPWDDDIDVVMDRKNFEKLKKLSVEGKLPKNFAFEDSLFLKGCRVPKIRDKSVSVIDKNSGEGIFIDIFPMDCYNKFDVMLLSIAAKGLKIRNSRGRFKFLPIKFLYVLLSWIPYSFFILTRKIYSGLSLSDGNYLGIAPVCNVEHFFSKSLFECPVLRQFEDEKFPVPNGYDAILKQCYGDYMVPVDYKENHY